MLPESLAPVSVDTTQIKHRSPFEKAEKLVKPTLPLDFVDFVLICDVGDEIQRWLIEVKAPQEVLDLFGVYGWAFMYLREADQNQGLVSEMLNEWAAEGLISGLQALYALREKCL